MMAWFEKIIDEIVFRSEALWSEAVSIWLQGGWAMIAIAVVAFVMFAMGFHVNFGLRRKRFDKVPEKTWRRWIDAPEERKGQLGDMLNAVTIGTTIRDTTLAFQNLRAEETANFDRDLRVMKICVSAAPLVGLLGTVTGMLTTFGALSTGSGGDKTMGAIAAGISEALITTETGLVVALPGLFMQYHLSRKYGRYKAFLAHVESVCAQARYRSISRPEKSAAAA